MLEAEGAIEAFKKTSPRALDEVAHETGLGVESIEIWFQDEARIGQKNKITRRWASCGGTPPQRSPRFQRTACVLYFRCRLPEGGHGRGSGYCSDCNTAAMNLHLAEIAAAIAPSAHAVLIVDQAGWHMSKRLVVPRNITLIPLPPKCPELNPVENSWQFMRDNWPLEPRLQIPRRSPRSLLCGLEQAHRSTVAHHVHRIAPIGPWVLINGIWYYTFMAWWSRTGGPG